MNVRLALLAGLSLLVVSCNDAAGPVVHGTAHLLNGASPAVGPLPNIDGRATAFSAPNANVLSANGYWLLSPDVVALKLTRITLQNGSNGSDATVDCTVTYDKSKTGLAQLGDCPFAVAAGTYTSVGLTFSSTYSVLINDAVNSIYSTPTGLVTTAPAGGALGFVVTVAAASPNPAEVGVSIPLPTPVTVSDAAPPSLNIVLNALQFFHVSITGGVVTLGWPGTNYADPFWPDIVASVGSLSNIAFYVGQGLTTSGSYCAGGTCSGAIPSGITSVSVYYTSASTPAMMGTQFNGTPTLCGPFGVGFMNDPRGYLGLDAGGNLGWAVPATNTWATYAVELRMAQVATLGATTTLYCKNRATDPAPSGGSYASGAPAIAVPGNSLGTYTLVAK